MISTITGQNSYTAHQALGRSISSFTDEHGKESVVRFDGDETEFTDLKDALFATSLFNPVSMVVIRSPSSNKVLSEKLAKIIEEIPDSTKVVIYEPTIDKRGAFYKLLKKSTEFTEYNNIEGPELVDWAVNYVQAKQSQIDRSTANYLVEVLGTDQWRLSTELDKLSNYSSIDRQKIDQMVEPEPKETIFQLLDQAAQGSTKQAIKTYRQLRKAKVEPQYVMGMIAWQLHNLVKVSVAKSTNAREIASEVNLSPFVVQKAQSALRRISRGRLAQILKVATEIDMKMKTTATDADDLIEQLILKI